MLGLKGAFVVIYESDVIAHILADTAHSLYIDRISVVGFDKATRYTFGVGALYALPCSLECMEMIALNYTGLHADRVKALCALIALGQPIPNGSDNPNGGLGIMAEHIKPKKPNDGGTNYQTVRVMKDWDEIKQYF